MEATFKLISETEYNKLNEKLDLILQNLSPQGSKPSGNDLGKWIAEKQAQDITGKKHPRFGKCVARDFSLSLNSTTRFFTTKKAS